MRATGLSEHLSGLRISAPDTIAGGVSGGRELIERDATAIVCASDSLAIGALESLRELRPRLFLPGQPAGPGLRAAVVGFDDTPVAAALGLSSVAQPVEDAARHIVRLLTYELAHHPAAGTMPDESLLLTPHVVERVPLPLAPPA
jgi:DNA-binding LacI/PurR family transcriptional regulator